MDDSYDFVDMGMRYADEKNKELKKNKKFWY